MPRKLKDAVVVVTGASSGIGRATARMFADKGAAVVVAARRGEALSEVATECEQLGGRGLAVPTDVSDEAEVRALAQQAIETFGRIDVWVNNASVTLFGRFNETPSEDYRRVIDVNLFGTIHGARAALPIFREQGQGVLINVSSIVTEMPQPYTSAYMISKHGIRALGMSLRQELALDGAEDIHVCTVLPATIDTPLFQHAANYTGRVPKALPPVYPAEKVASAIVGLARRPQREVMVGAAGRLIAAQANLAPGLTERTAATMVDQQHLQDTPAPPTSGNLFEPMSQWTTVSGGWKANEPRTMPRLAVAGLVAVPAIFLWRRQQGNGRRPKWDKVARATGVVARSRRRLG
jgi:NAD(P)-dependent dehydrogenase (short-subunit alcohol dehydrogenase family)